MGDDESRVFYGRDFDNWRQAQRSQAQVEDRALPKFYICLNLGDIRPENVKISITDRVVIVSGYQKEVTEDDDGMIRETFHGFSNEFGFPEDVDTNTVEVTYNPDQSIAIEADYYIPFASRLENKVPPAVYQRPSSVPSALSQRDHAVSRHDISKSINRSKHLPFSISSPSINNYLMPPAIDSAYDSSAAFGPSQMIALQNGRVPYANNTSRMPSQFGIPTSFSANQSKNMKRSVMYSQDNSFGLPPQFASNEMKILQSAREILPDNNVGSFYQFNSSAPSRQSVHTLLPPPADNSNDMQCPFNYSGPSNQVLPSTNSLPPDKSVAFLQLASAAQLGPSQMKVPQQSQRFGVDNNSNMLAQLNPYQMKALQQSQGFCTDNSCGLSPCQIKALQNNQRYAAENIYSSGTSLAPIHHDLTVQHSYIGKPSSTSNRISQVNRSLLKPGTRCETLPTYSQKYDYKVPGTRGFPSTQYRSETKVENRPQSFHGSIMNNARSSRHISKIR